jgi:hypothetical protein
MKRILLLLIVALVCLTTRAYSVSSFTSAETDSGVVINWTTASEADCYSWDIDRSFFADSNYQTIASMPGHGTTSVPHDYTWTDNTVVAVNTYYYRLVEVDAVGSKTYYGPISVLVSLYGVAGEPEVISQPTGNAPLQNSPNPFRYSTNITYNLAKPGRVSIKIYNTTGQLIRVLHDGFQPAGGHSEAWNGRDDRNNAIANGLYICRLVIGNRCDQRQIILIK